MKRPALLFSFMVLTIIPFLAQVQQTAAPAESAAGPEMARLAKALGGDWNTTEIMERSAFFPEGGSRRGVVHVRIAAGGTTLIYEVRSDGSAGKLDGMLIFWWDKVAGIYRLFVCFNNPNSPCRMRGTAHWEGDTFVNDYETMAEGKMAKWRDTFIIKPDSHTLVAAVDTGNGTMKTLITTTGTRH